MHLVQVSLNTTPNFIYVLLCRGTEVNPPLMGFIVNCSRLNCSIIKGTKEKKQQPKGTQERAHTLTHKQGTK